MMNNSSQTPQPNPASPRRTSDRPDLREINSNDTGEHAGGGTQVSETKPQTDPPQ